MENDQKDLGAQGATEDVSAGSSAPAAAIARRTIVGNRSMLAAALMVAASGHAMASAPTLFRALKGPTPNKYQPHQGAREKARRVRQAQRLAERSRP